MPITTLDSRTALVVIDLQRGLAAAPFVHPFPGIVSRAHALAAAFRQRGLPVAWVTVDGMPPGRTERSRRFAELPTDFAELVPELVRQPGDHLVTKRTPGAFTGTGLDVHLRKLGVTQIVLAGVATAGGVEVTGRHAFELGFHVGFAVDAMTDQDAATHEHSVTRIFPKLGETGTTQDFVDLLQRSA
ncbi:cysteine hydrolase family protein [Dyella sedimenti]|uniref:cysteine hydrolase family protein n=1 Tax=Dyella sedimenti TaxID=2919947 RepID=UPI001FAAED07|nr:cysteine hydrolase [Dyella sedimenti]